MRARQTAPRPHASDSAACRPRGRLGRRCRDGNPIGLARLSDSDSHGRPLLQRRPLVGHRVIHPLQVAGEGRVIRGLGSFLQRYRDRLEMEARESADNDPVLTAIAHATAGGWRGTAAELAHRIKDAAAEGVAGRDWPRSGGKMGAYLKRVAPVARKAGWTFTDDGVDRSRKVKAWLIEPPAPPTQG